MNLKDQKGYTMVAVIVTVVILSIMITAVSTLALSDVRKSQLWRDKTSAFYLAESGINDAIHGIISGEITELPNHYTSMKRIEGLNANANAIRYDFGSNNFYEVWIERADLLVKITSKGTWNKKSEVVQQELKLPALFPAPTSANKVIELCPSPPNADPIDYVANYVPPDISVSMPPGSDEKALDINNASSPISGNHYYSNITNSTGSPKTLQFIGPAVISVAGDVDLGSNTTIITEGNVTFKIAGSLTFGQESNLESNNGQVNFYVGKDANFNGDYYGNSAGNNDLNLNQEPTKLIVYLATVPVPQAPTTDPPSGYFVDISNNTKFIGGICAPSANVKLSTNSITNGALIGWEVIWGSGEGEGNNNKPVVTYDLSMATIPSPGVNGTLLGWSEQ